MNWGEKEEEQKERQGGRKQNKAGCNVGVWRRGGEGEEAPSLAPSGVIGSWTTNLSQLNQQRPRWLQPHRGLLGKKAGRSRKDGRKQPDGRVQGGVEEGGKMRRLERRENGVEPKGWQKIEGNKRKKKGEGWQEKRYRKRGLETGWWLPSSEQHLMTKHTAEHYKQQLLKKNQTSEVQDVYLVWLKKNGYIFYSRSWKHGSAWSTKHAWLTDATGERRKPSGWLYTGSVEGQLVWLEKRPQDEKPHAGHQFSFYFKGRLISHIFHTLHIPKY